MTETPNVPIQSQDNHFLLLLPIILENNPPERTNKLTSKARTNLRRIYNDMKKVPVGLQLSKNTLYHERLKSIISVSTFLLFISPPERTNKELILVYNDNKSILNSAVFSKMTFKASLK